MTRLYETRSSGAAGANRFVASIPLAILILGSLASAGCQDDSTEPHRQDGLATRDLFHAEDVSGIMELGVEVRNGSIGLTTGNGDQIEARIHVHVRAETDEDAEDFASAVQLDLDRDGSVFRMEADEPRLPDGAELETHWTIEIPHGLDLELQTINGGILVEGRVGSVDADTQNGSISVRGSSAGPLRFAAVNGALEVDLDELEGDAALSTTNGAQEIAFAHGTGSVHADAVNGAIWAVLPYEYSGSLDASVVNGGVSCSIPLTETEVRTQTHVRGTVGEGGPSSVELRTVNGGIEISRQRN